MNQLPQETKPEEKEFQTIVKQDVMYIPSNEGEELPKDTNEAKAIGIMNMTSPTTKEAVLTMSKMVRPAILRGNFLAVFEQRINQLRGNPANLIRPLYPPFTFLSLMKNAIDLQSVGDGSARMEMTAILAQPEYNPFDQFGGGGRNQVFENIRRNFGQPVPPHLQGTQAGGEVKQPKKSFFNRNKTPEQ